MAISFNKEKVAKVVSGIVLPGGFILLILWLFLFLYKKYGKKNSLVGPEAKTLDTTKSIETNTTDPLEDTSVTINSNVSN